MTPKEEPKQECPHPEPRKDYYRDGCFKCWQCGKIVVEHNNYKQETLEEAAKRIISDMGWVWENTESSARIVARHCAKWQQERMYNEESECVNMYLDDLSIQRKSEDGQEYSIVGRIKQLEKKYLKEMSDVESHYLSKKERMYSDMQEYAEFCIRCYEKGMPCIIAEDWFEQFKKK
jgi:hypothetical protein